MIAVGYLLPYPYSILIIMGIIEDVTWQLIVSSHDIIEDIH